jgi:hypothetical protein
LRFCVITLLIIFALLGVNIVGGGMIGFLATPQLI